MNLRLSLMISSLLFGAAGAGFGDGPKEPGGAGEERSIALVYLADLHAQLETHPEFFWRAGRNETTAAGGIPRIAAVLEKIRREKDGKVLAMDAGDTIQGSAPAAWSKGRVVVPGLNALNLDLGIPGNWEVVYGADVLRERAKEFRHPLIAANVKDAKTKRLLFPPYFVKDVGGVRVGVIGYTDPEVPSRQPPGYSRGLAYDGDKSLPTWVEKLRREEKADVVVLLTHVGLPKSIRLGETLKGVDFVFSGDTHERTYEPIVRDGVWIVEPGGFGSFLGRLDLTVRDGEIVDRKWDLIELRADRFPEDPEVKRTVERSLAPYRAKSERKIGETTIPLMRYDVLETSVDDVLTDAIREAAGTEIGLSNGFRFSPPTPAGPIAERDLWNWLPIGTPLKIGRVSGAQLKAFWERELEHVFAKDPMKLFGGWLPRASGMSVRFVAHAPQGERVREIRVGGEPLKADRIYTIAACEREGDAIDTLCRIRRVGEPKVLDFDVHEAVRRYLARHSPLADPSGRRVVAEDLPRHVRSQVLK